MKAKDQSQQFWIKHGSRRESNTVAKLPFHCIPNEHRPPGQWSAGVEVGALALAVDLRYRPIVCEKSKKLYLFIFIPRPGSFELRSGLGKAWLGWGKGTGYGSSVIVLYEFSSSRHFRYIYGYVDVCVYMGINLYLDRSSREISREVEKPRRNLTGVN